MRRIVVAIVALSLTLVFGDVTAYSQYRVGRSPAPVARYSRGRVVVPSVTLRAKARYRARALRRSRAFRRQPAVRVVRPPSPRIVVGRRAIVGTYRPWWW
jgi:hypothetical protein